MNVLYIHLGSDEHIKESDEICGEPAEEFLRRTLSTALSTDDKYSILALDFEDIAIFKIGAVRRTL